MSTAEDKTEVKEDGEIKTELNILIDAIEYLDKAVISHGDVIETVMSQSRPNDAADEKQRELSSPLALIIRENRNKLQMITEKLVSFSGRVEL